MICFTDKHHVPFQIDEDHYEIVSHYTWGIVRGYCCTHIPQWGILSSGKRVKIGNKNTYLHILLFGRLPENLEWDHIDQDKLNNQRANLRATTHQGNSLNRPTTGWSGLGLSGIVGIRYCAGRWRALIRSHESHTGKQLCLGTFDTIEEANKARNSYLEF